MPAPLLGGPIHFARLSGIGNVAGCSCGAAVLLVAVEPVAEARLSGLGTVATAAGCSCGAAVDCCWLLLAAAGCWLLVRAAVLLAAAGCWLPAESVPELQLWLSAPLPSDCLLALAGELAARAFLLVLLAFLLALVVVGLCPLCVVCSLAVSVATM